MSDGECTNPVHGRTQPRFWQSETHCRECGGPKWKWASWSRARERMRVLVHEIAAFERGRHVKADRSCEHCGVEHSEGCWCAYVTPVDLDG